MESHMPGWFRLRCSPWGFDALARPVRWGPCLCLGISLLTSSCVFKKAPRAFTPPPIAAKPAPVISPAVLELPDASVWDFPILAELPDVPTLPPFTAPRPPAPPKQRPPVTPPKNASTLPAPNTEPQPEPV